MTSWEQIRNCIISTGMWHKL